MDGNDSFTKLLLHCDGTDAGTTFINGAAGGSATVTAVGAAQIDTAQSVFGGAAALLEAAGNFLSCSASADWNFGTGDFVVDFRARFVSTVVGAPDGNFDLMFVWSDDGTNNNVLYFLLDGTEAQFFAKTAGVTVAHYRTTHATVLNVWYHFAFVRSGSSFFIIKDGISQALATTVAIGSNAMPDLSAHAMRVGGQTLPGPGWMDEVRISKGTDRGWTSNITVPPAAYGHEIAAAAGSYALTGVAAPLVPSMAEGAGSFSLAGVAAGAVDALAGGVGAYALSGIDAALRTREFFQAGAGAYALTGQPILFHPDLHLTSTERLHNPVDYVLAREARYPVRRARLR